jgi:hypothetical protein
MTKKLGLRTDHLPIEQPQNSARFVLNAVLDSNSGTLVYQNENGTEAQYAHTSGYKFIGSINLDKNNIVLFFTNNTNSEIGLFNKGVYTTLINTSCLGFKQSNPIKGVFKILNGCDRVIYFNDGLNTDKSINIDNLELYQNSAGQWDCNLMSLNPDFLIPEITVNQINNNGGNLEPGGYSFVVELLDDNLNTITTGFQTDFVKIYTDNLSDQYDSIHGSLPSTINSIEGGNTTTKSIELTLSNLDTSFSFARVIVIAKTTGTGFSERVYELQDYIPISKSNINYTISTLEGAVTTDIEALEVKSVKYTTSNENASHRW